jgi:hypothetical protein
MLSQSKVSSPSEKKREAEKKTSGDVTKLALSARNDKIS